MLLAIGHATAQEHQKVDVKPHASGQTVRHKHSSGAYTFEHPADWTVHEQGGRTYIGTSDGLQATERGFRTIYGAFITLLDVPAGATSLDDAARAVVENILSRNPHQKLHTPVHADGTLAGAPAASAVIMGTSPVTGRGERAQIVIRRYGESQLLYLMLVSPTDHFSTLEQPLRRLRDSIQVADEARPR
jgi:hypothetical protein